MIDLDSHSLQLIHAILKKHLPGVEVKAFGSRTTGKAKPFSDLDLVLIDAKPIPIEKINALKFEFSNSDLPIMVDLVDWQLISEEFREKIKVDAQSFPGTAQNS